MSKNPGWGRITSLFLCAICLWATPGCGDAVTPTVAAATRNDSTGSGASPDSTRIPSPDSLAKTSPDTGGAHPIADSTTTTHTDSSIAKATPAHIVSLQLRQGNLSVVAGGTLQVTASATMSDGTSGNLVAVSWSATNGTITTGGLYTAGSAGAGSVVATNGAATASAQVLITAPPEAILPVVPARSADAFVNSIGVNVHLSYFGSPYGTAWQSVIMPGLTQLGIHHVRDAGTVVTDDGWMSSVYGRMQQLANNGIKFDLVLSPLIGTTDFATYNILGRLLQFAGTSVESFEGLNEHDLSGRATWVSDVQTFQAAFFAAVRADSRSAAMPIYGPSIGHPVNAAAVGNLSGLVDVGNVHPYPGGNVPMTNLWSYESQLQSIDGTGHPWVVTETGYHNALTSTSGNRPVSEAAAGRYIPRLVLDNFLAGVTRTYLYEFIDEGTDPTNQEQNFGLLRNDGSSKPAYTALQNLITELADPGPSFTPTPLHLVVSGDTTGVMMAVFGKRNGTYDVVLWQEVSSYNLTTQSDVSVSPRSVTLALQGSPSVRVFTPLTSASPLAAGSRRTSITISVPDHPVVIELTP